MEEKEKEKGVGGQKYIFSEKGCLWNHHALITKNEKGPDGEKKTEWWVGK